MVVSLYIALLVVPSGSISSTIITVDYTLEKVFMKNIVAVSFDTHPDSYNTFFPTISEITRLRQYLRSVCMIR